jgi:nucleolar complex protein 2
VSSKPPPHTPKFNTLQKLIKAFFHNIISLLDQLTDPEMLQLAVLESAKLVPWVLNNRRGIKIYLKVC